MVGVDAAYAFAANREGSKIPEYGAGSFSSKGEEKGQPAKPRIF
jgi:hypothetical protein